MTRKFQHGLVIGKFYPPHRGHEYLIRCAAEQSGYVSVIVMAADVEALPLELRVQWLQEIFAAEPRVTVVGVVDNEPVDYACDRAWRVHIEHMRRGLGLASRARSVTVPAVDAVFTSEPYGEELARRFDAASVCVDASRLKHPVSGTDFRRDPVARWFDVAACVRESLCQRIVIVGAESTGKSTLAAALLEVYRERGGSFACTQLVEEYGREYTEQKLASARSQHGGVPLDQLTWQPGELEHIAMVQQARENAAARASGPLLLCDTDALATSIWHERYTNRSSPVLRAFAAAAPRRASYLLTSWKEVPFEQDGLRDGEHIRGWMHQRFVDELTQRGAAWLLLQGALQARVEAAVAWIDSRIDSEVRRLYALERRDVDRSR